MPAFGALHAHDERCVVGVVTTAPRPSGRDGALQESPVATWAREHDLPLLEVERLRDPTTLETIASLDATVGLLSDFGQIVPREMLRTIPRGILNLHPSLLPAYRGASPIAKSTTCPKAALIDDGVPIQIEPRSSGHFNISGNISIAVDAKYPL